MNIGMINKVRHFFTDVKSRKLNFSFLLPLSKKISFLQNNILFFLPAITLVLGGVLTFQSPEFLVPVFATFFIVTGILAGIAGWKLVQFYGRIKGILKRFEGGVVLQGINVRGPSSSKELFDSLFDPNDTKGTILH